MATVVKTMQPSVHPLAPGGEPDGFYLETEPNGVTLDTRLFFGKFFSANSATSLYDFREIPRGTLFTAAKLEIMGHTTQSTVFQIDIDAVRGTGVLVPGQSSQHCIPTDASLYGEARFTCAVFMGVTPLSPENVATWSDVYDIHFDARYGLALRFQQVMSIDTTGNIVSINLSIGKLGTTLGTGKVYANVYRAVPDEIATTGVWAKGELLKTGDTDYARKDFSFIPAVQTTKSFLIGESAADSVAVESGDTVICELVFEPSSGASADAGISAGYDVALSGGFYPMRLEAAPGKKLQGFQGVTGGVACLSGKEWRAQVRAVLGGTTERITVPAITAGVLSTWGSAKYSPDLELGQTFLDLLNEAVQRCDADEDRGFDRWAGIRFANVDAANLEFRQIRSTRNASPTVGSLFGLVLTVEYRADAACYEGSELGNAVEAGAELGNAVHYEGSELPRAVTSAGAAMLLAVVTEGQELHSAVDATATIEDCT